MSQFIYYILFVGVVILVSWNMLDQDSVQKIPVDGYRLIWSDEFSGKSLDLSKWKYYQGKRKDAFNTGSQVFLDGSGFLHLQVKTSGDSVLAGMITSQHLFESKYGYFECRAKLTNVMGIWPAFWLQSGSMAADYGTPETNGVEIDIFEYFPNFKKDTVTHNLHWGGYGISHRELGLIPAPLQKTASDFHVFGLEWTDHSYTAYVDGKETAKGTDYISKVEQFIILSIECSGAAGPLDKTALPADYVIDYVRVYKKNG